MIGKIISHYRILDKLGEGGMGEVYRVQDTRLGRLAALESLLHAEGSEAASRIMRLVAPTWYAQVAPPGPGGLLLRTGPG